MLGGRREGAGRKPGAPNKATQERQRQVAATGITPLDYMLEVMRKPIPADVDPAVRVAMEAMRFEAAKAAAPYVHPRLSAMQHSGELVHKHVARVPAVANNAESWSKQYAPALPAPTQRQ